MLTAGKYYESKPFHTPCSYSSWFWLDQFLDVWKLVIWL